MPATSSIEFVRTRTFLETIPPGAQVGIICDPAHVVGLTAITLHCDSKPCGGERQFETQTSVVSLTATNTKVKDEFIYYRCRNCKVALKTFAVRFTKNAENILAQKLGEMPNFGPPTPTRLLTILGEHKEIFLKGRRAENQGMGIAAFAYYRRIVENIKDELIGEIIKVATTLNAPPEMLKDLAAARGETKFRDVVDRIRHGIPESLLIDGRNPLTLLHSALSEGLHKLPEDACLRHATAIRLVLAELVERVGIALKVDNELRSAISSLMQKP